jgi:hypothetical protein
VTPTDEIKFTPVSLKPPLHVHVGAGKLAMGLVIPSLLESNVPLVVLQTARAPWDAVRSSAVQENALKGTDHDVESRLHFTVEHRHKPLRSMRLIFADDDARGFAREKPDPSEPSKTFILSDDFENVWMPLLRNATSVSTAVGPALVDWLGADLLSKLPSAERGEDGSRSELPKVYCCENDHEAVDALATSLRGKAHVVPCVVDKVCSKLRVEGPEDEDPEDGFSAKYAKSATRASSAKRRWTAEVHTEAYPGMILPLDPVPDTSDPYFPFDAVKNHQSVLRLCRNRATASFLRRKKLAQVNGVHTCLAFASLRDAPLRNFEGKYSVESLSDVHLRSLESVSQTLSDEVWTWAVAESLAVVFDHDAELITEALAPDLKPAAPNLSNLSNQATRPIEPLLETIDDFVRREYAGRSILRDARDSLARLSSSARSDTVGRVLNAGVIVRLEGRMKVTRDVVREGARASERDPEWIRTNPIVSTILSESGFDSVRDLSNAVDEVYEACAAVGGFVVKGAEERERLRKNAVSRPSWATKKPTAE